MAQIHLTKEQTRMLINSTEPVEIRDASGTMLGSLPPHPDAELIKRAKERSNSPGPWYSGKEIQERLQELQQASENEGGFDRDRMHEILKELRQKGID